jgi:isocitrate lyase
MSAAQNLPTELTKEESQVDAAQRLTKRFDGIVRNYTKSDVQRLRGTFAVRHTLAELGANRLWKLLHEKDYVAALGALTGNQAVQQVRAGLDAI